MKNGRLYIIFVMLLAVVLLPAVCSAQEADEGANTPRPNTDQPSSLKEMLAKMRIDQEKKEYDELVDRGQQAVKLSTELEQSFQQNASLRKTDREKLDDLEKLVKKIRNELGAEGSIDDPDENGGDDAPKDAADGLRSLQDLTNKLVDELKKTTRFGVSAIAIQSSNSALRVVKFLRFSK
jgi:hypothetical protein